MQFPAATGGTYFDKNGDGRIYSAVVTFDSVLTVLPDRIVFRNPEDQTESFITTAQNYKMVTGDPHSITVSLPSSFTSKGSTGFTAGPYGTVSSVDFIEAPFSIKDGVGPIITRALYVPSKAGTNASDTLKITLSEAVGPLAGSLPSAVFQYFDSTGLLDKFAGLASTNLKFPDPLHITIELPQTIRISPLQDSIALQGGTASPVADGQANHPAQPNRHVVIEWGIESSLEISCGPNPFVPGQTQVPQFIRDFFPGGSAPQTGTVFVIQSTKPIKDGDCSIFDHVGNLVIEGLALAKAPNGFKAYIIWDGHNRSGRSVSNGSYLAIIHARDVNSSLQKRTMIGVWR
jgi:hypothetical protein